MSLVALIPVLGTVLDKLLPDKAAADAAKLQLLDLAAKQDAALLDTVARLTEATAETNTAEASGNWFTAGWRPAIGYVLGMALGYTYILGPILAGAAAIWWPEAKVPALQLDDNLWELILGLLGLAGWRTLDKIKAK
jgi:Holin of 3TMs, for gene-transfer release